MRWKNGTRRRKPSSAWKKAIGTAAQIREADMGVWSSPHQAFIDECLKEEEEMAEVDFVRGAIEVPKAELVPVDGADRQPADMMSLLQLALKNNAAIDVIERLVSLQEKMLARQAEIEF